MSSSVDRASQPALLDLNVFGRFEAVAGGRGLDIAGIKSQALLAYLVLCESTIETRSRLAGLLWSESDETRARASLRQALVQLRQSLETIAFVGLDARKTEVRLAHSSFRVDLRDALVAAERGQVHPALTSGKHPFERVLAGFEDLDPAFRVWLMAKRQAWHDRAVRALESHLISQAGDVDRDAIATALLNLDPTHEEACRFLMRRRAAAGDVGTALRLYKSLWDVLDAEFDVEPSQTTQDLAVEIKTGQVVPDTVMSRPVTMPGNPSADGLPSTVPPLERFASNRIALVVDPIDLSNVPRDSGYLVHGFRHELIACLVRFREWSVRDRARQPGAVGLTPAGTSEFLVETTALAGDNNLRLVLTLKDAASDRYIWSDRFAVTLPNWFAVQQTIVSQLATAMNVHISAERLARLPAGQGASTDIYDQWLVGQSLVNGYSAPDWRRAIDIFTDVARRAPTFSPAYSSLVQLLNQTHLVHPGARRERDREREALNFAKTAARLDPVDSRAQLCLGWAHAMSKQYDEAETFLRLATELNASDPWTLVSAAHAFAFCARPREAVDLSEQAMGVALPPSRIHWGYQVGTRFLCGDFEGSIEAADRAEDVILNLAGWKTAALFHAGRRDEAVKEGQRFIARARSAWTAPTSPTDAEIAEWFLHLFPIKDPDMWERLRSGLAGAGIPVGSARHHGW